jgi:hypothetical protein
MLGGDAFERQAARPLILIVTVQAMLLQKKTTVDSHFLFGLILR